MSALAWFDAWYVLSLQMSVYWSLSTAFHSLILSFFFNLRNSTSQPFICKLFSECLFISVFMKCFCTSSRLLILSVFPFFLHLTFFLVLEIQEVRRSHINSFPNACSSLYSSSIRLIPPFPIISFFPFFFVSLFLHFQIFNKSVFHM